MRFAPIFYFNCEIFSLYCKTKTNKNSQILWAKNPGFIKIEFCWRLIFEILIIHKPSLGSCEIPQKKFEPNRYSRLTVYWIQTNRHPNPKTSQIYICSVLSTRRGINPLKIIDFTGPGGWCWNPTAPSLNMPLSSNLKFRMGFHR